MSLLKGYVTANNRQHYAIKTDNNEVWRAPRGVAGYADGTVASVALLGTTQVVAATFKESEVTFTVEKHPLSASGARLNLRPSKTKQGETK